MTRMCFYLLPECLEFIVDLCKNNLTKAKRKIQQLRNKIIINEFKQCHCIVQVTFAVGGEEIVTEELDSHDKT